MAKDITPTEPVKVEQERVIAAATHIMESCQEKGFTELETYMAMTYIANSMEETLGFGRKRNTQA